VRETYLSISRKAIAETIGRIEAVSSMYETASWGRTGQPDYINQLLIVKTELPPETILRRILSIEKELGRQRNEKWESRVIDIDILFYDNCIIKQPDLTVPHPLLHQRRFALEPLAELEPEWVHPVYNVNVKELLEKLTDNLPVKRIKNNTVL